MKKITMSILIGFLIGQVIAVSLRPCGDHNRINDLIVDRNHQNKTLDSCFWICSKLCEDAIKQINTVKKENDSLKNRIELTDFYKSESEYYQGVCHKIVKDETIFIKNMIKQVKQK